MLYTPDNPRQAPRQKAPVPRRALRRPAASRRKAAPEPRAAESPLGPMPTDADFPGCHSVPMSAEEFACFDRHIEYWDARRGGVAWMVADVSRQHERPTHRLSILLHYISQARGAPIECYGTMSLCEHDAHGKRRRVIEADQTVYLDIARANIRFSPVMVRGDHDPPDLVIEVDNTTDARRRKLAIYEEWGFPEVWIEVPDAPAKSRPKSRRSELAIYALRRGRFEERPASIVLPGWTAEEIHVALNERAISEGTCAALERVGLALGRQEGTGPDNDPFLRNAMLGARAEGRAEGLEAGRAEGLEAGRAEGLEALRKARIDNAATAVRAVLGGRGLALPAHFLADGAALANVPLALAVGTALAAKSAEDFLHRIRA